MKRITATEAARQFADVLDAVEQAGETFIVERRGRTVAKISPARTGNGREIIELLSRAPRDDSALEEIMAVRALLDDRLHDWPD